MPYPDSYDILNRESAEANWTDASQVVLMCHFLDQLHARFPGTEDDGILGDFERYLIEQAEVEREANDE
jgi:hypothetical protein